MPEEETKEDEARLQELKKYIEEKKEKKIYSVYLTKEDVELVRKKLKVPLSKYLDDMIRIMAMTIKKSEEKEEKQKEIKKEDDAKNK